MRRKKNDALFVTNNTSFLHGASSLLSGLNEDFLDRQGAAVHRQNCQRDLLIEPAFAAAAGIQPEPPVNNLLKIPVGVPKDHRVNAGQVFGYFLFVVYQKEPAVLNLEGQCCGDVLCPRLVVVASDYINRSDFLQFLPEDKKADVEADYDTISTTVQGFKIGVMVKNRTPYSSIEFIDNGAPFQFGGTLHFDAVPSDPSKTDIPWFLRDRSWS